MNKPLPCPRCGKAPLVLFGISTPGRYSVLHTCQEPPQHYIELTADKVLESEAIADWNEVVEQMKGAK